MDPIELQFTVECSPEHAFDTWARRIGVWWPKSHSVSADPAVSVRLEPRPGGRIYERTPDGARTTLSIVHTGWEVLGAEWRERNERAWGALLRHYRAACSVTL